MRRGREGGVRLVKEEERSAEFKIPISDLILDE